MTEAGVDPRHRRLHEPGAGARQVRRQAHRHLGVRLRALRDAHGQAARSSARTSRARSRACSRSARTGRAAVGRTARRAPHARALPREGRAQAHRRHARREARARGHVRDRGAPSRSRGGARCRSRPRLSRRRCSRAGRCWLVRPAAPPQPKIVTRFDYAVTLSGG